MVRQAHEPVPESTASRLGLPDVLLVCQRRRERRRAWRLPERFVQLLQRRCRDQARVASQRAHGGHICSVDCRGVRRVHDVGDCEQVDRVAAHRRQGPGSILRRRGAQGSPRRCHPGPVVCYGNLHRRAVRTAGWSIQRLEGATGRPSLADRAAGHHYRGAGRRDRHPLPRPLADAAVSRRRGGGRGRCSLRPRRAIKHVPVFHLGSWIQSWPAPSAFVQAECVRPRHSDSDGGHGPGHRGRLNV
mmetsp:Transcript_11435/g.34463  ORF Transcript_11435/g.34463 Transcript_11435/m.34463 type:complete len:245 (-) Transcript_11435:718-1452(-)